MKIKHSLLFAITFLSWIFLFPENISASAPVFEEDFSGSYAKWQDVRETFDLWEIQNEAARVFIDTRSTLAELVPKDEFWNQDWKNYSYEVEINYVRGVDKMLAFWFQDIFNWYQIHFVGGNYILSHISEGKEVWNEVGSVNLSGKNKLRVDLIDGEISLFINDTHAFTHFDPTFDSDHGSIALKAGAGSIFPAEVFFDSISVSLIQNNLVELPVPFFAQHDPNWKDIEYDSASIWAITGSTIYDWGCLLSSIVMTLHYHSITQLPTGELITPASLNTWLQNQEDGYILEGLINWSAITRLVKQIHDVHATTKLEYSRVVDNQLQIAATQLINSIPVIFQVPGHFLVGTGLTLKTDKQTSDHFLISDPLYNYTHLSEHFDINSQENPLSQIPVSTRLLIPSNTDLSYIYIAHSKNISSQFINLNEQQYEAVHTSTEYLTNSNQTESSQEIILHEIQKPETGIFTFELSLSENTQNKFVKESITVFAYDTEGNLNNLSFETVLQKNSTLSYSIEFQKDAASDLKNNYSFSDLVTELTTLANSQMFNTHYSYNQLLFLARKAALYQKQEPISFATSLHSRYVHAIESELVWFTKAIREETKNLITDRLKQLAHP